MKLSLVVDEYVADMRRMGRINSDHTEAAYRAKLNALIDDTGNRDPVKIGRNDIKRTLSRWAPPMSPNSQRQAHSVLVSFFDWCMEEERCDRNPARGVRPPKRREPDTYRMTLPEVMRFWAATEGHRRDRWVAALGFGSGLRSQEIRLLRGEHLARDGWVWVSSDIGKGHKARWMPVLAEFQDSIDEMIVQVPHDRLVLPGRRWINPQLGDEQGDADTPLAASSLYKQVKRIAQRAGLPDQITPHSLRHAFGDSVAKYAGLRVAQALMGHASVETTAGTYTDHVGLDELAANVREFSYGLSTPKEVQTPDANA